MKILSHRGYWKEVAEKNTIEAMRRSFSLGFGTETDVRDYNGELVISHDIADENAISFQKFLEIYGEYNKDLPLALNIKSDGLQLKLKEALARNKIENYFLFDMSIPDALGYLRNEVKNVFTRQSEYEKDPSFYEKANGVWLDSFEEDWFDNNLISAHLARGKMVCIVSPELHKRSHLESWKKYKFLSTEKNLFLCTDFPEEAHEFFN